VGTKSGGGFTNTLDGWPEILVGTGPGTKATVKVYTNVLTTRDVVQTIWPFSAGKKVYKNGITLSWATITADGVPDVVIGSENGGGSQVEIWAWNGTGQLFRWAAWAAFGDSPSRGAPVRATAFDGDGDGIAERVAAVQGPGGTVGQVRFFQLDAHATSGPRVRPLSPPLAAAGPFFIASVHPAAPTPMSPATKAPSSAPSLANGEGEATWTATLTAAAGAPTAPSPSEQRESHPARRVTPLDALRIINHLNHAGSAAHPVDLALLDIDRDGSVTPLDGLLVINRVNGAATDDYFTRLGAEA